MSKKDKICTFTGKEYDCSRCEGHREDWTDKGTRSTHMGHSVSGPIRRNKAKDWRGMAKYMTKDDGSPVTGEEIQIEFMRYHAKGWETIPLKQCDRWCYKNGCQGHKEASQ